LMPSDCVEIHSLVQSAVCNQTSTKTKKLSPYTTLSPMVNRILLLLQAD
jgi:hypothetical protein